MNNLSNEVAEVSLENRASSSVYFTAKSQDGFRLYDQSTFEPVSGFSAVDGVRTSCFSGSGNLLAYVTSSRIKVIDVRTMEEVFSVDETCFYLFFSPKAGQLVTWSQFSNDTPNLKVWSLSEGKPVFSKLWKRSDCWQPQYTIDEHYVAFMVTDGVELYTPQEFSKPSRKITVPNIAAFALSRKKEFYIATFSKAHDSMPGAVRIYSKRNLQTPTAIKSFYKTDSAEISWNKNGTHLLITSKLDFDRSNKSYYGESLLYYMDATGKMDTNIKLPKEGPVYQAEWHPSNDQFIVVYGFAPAKATLFDITGTAIYDYGTGNRNCVKFSPDGKVVCLAGFGNLRGEMEFFELSNSMQLLSKFMVSDTTHWEFFPDSDHLLMATTTPRLRVNNCMQIYHYNGTRICKKDLVECYEVQVQKQPSSKIIKNRKLIPVQDNAKAEKKVNTAYRPPSARGTTSTLVINVGEEKPRALVNIANNNGGGDNSSSNSISKPVKLPPGMSMSMYTKMLAARAENKKQ